MQQHPDPDSRVRRCRSPRRRSRSRRSPSLTMTMATKAITGRGTRNGSWVEFGKKEAADVRRLSGHGLRRQTVGGHA